MPITTLDDLDVAYTVRGPEYAPVVLLLHGWPDDASTWDPVAEKLTASGLRTVAPFLRGFGDTRFRSEMTPRTGDTGVLAMDAIGLMNAIGIDRFSVVGHDWGSNVAEALAVGWPERVERIAMLATTPRLGGTSTPDFRQAKLDWYQWFMTTPLGAQAVDRARRDFAHLQWTDWGPPGWFEEETFARVARAWDNPDWLEVTLHSYRSRWNLAMPDPQGAWLVAKVEATKTLSLPVLIVQGQVDRVSPPDGLHGVADKFTGSFEIVTLARVGHFPQREAPDELAAHLLGFFGKNPRTGS